jgi:hypothetical protein
MKTMAWKKEGCLEKLNAIKNNLGDVENKQLDELLKYINDNLSCLINYEEQRNSGLPYIK